ncbi:MULTISPECIES: serine/threonine-protein kinase [unclassified Streptomyces]|uniref:serine/threonine-protein kinase n=1 Tax=unclassified Streptomyces TaxID=2593676 RepID=UPI000DB9F47E|nr:MULTISPECIES: serine/threonine-protein kinase [unclassified Streptomyces]MYT68392.1 protein kinase [Streptomyces sp. SID8367]RAJ86064.1 serine/threonine protein kinase [Streptomyces sp. PsTaAH-137]
MQPLQADEPTTVGPYRLLGRLGAGGMGRVYLGRSAGGRTVAVKIVHPHFALDDEFRARFRREVAAARRVGGAWTAAVLDADPEAPVPWVATGYVAGPALAQAAGPGRALPEHSVRVLGAGLAEALAAVHGLGLVHRDVKPGNVLLTVDGPRLIDFGIARATDGTASLTSTGVSIGSPGYMAPEQILGKGVTGASDVFSLGAVLVYAATGESPFPGDSSAALLYKVVHEEPELGALRGELRDVVAGCLAKSAADRPGPDEVARRLAPEGAAALVAAGWLPGALVEQVMRGAARLLDMEGADPATGPVGFSSPAVTGGAPGVFGPPDPSYAAVPLPRGEATVGDAAKGGPADARPGRLSMSVSATSTPATANGRGRKVSCSVALAVAGALAAVTVGGILVVNMLPGSRNDASGGAADGAHPTASAQPSVSASASSPQPSGTVPSFYLGTWEGKATVLGIQADTYRVELKQTRVGGRLGTVTSTDLTGNRCVDELTLRSATATEVVASGKKISGDAFKCADGSSTVHLSRDGAGLRYTSEYPKAGNPTADLKRVGR